MVFPSSIRPRQQIQQQESSPPPPGSGIDSFYGVRSLNGSMCNSWESSGDDGIRDGTTPFGSHQEDKEERVEIDLNSIPHESLIGALTLDTPQSPGSSATSVDQTPLQSQLSIFEETSPVATIRRTLTPPSPEASTTGWQSNDMDQQSSSNRYQTNNEIFLHSLMHLDNLPLDPVSEPSSPASFTSLPSYVASISSMSRTSSPARSAFDLTISSSHFPTRGGHSPLGHDDLVLPTIDLPSTSLHLSSSLRRWNGGGVGPDKGVLKVAVLGGEDGWNGLLAGLREHSEVIEVVQAANIDRRELQWRVIQGGKTVAVLLTGLNAEEIRSRVLSTYTTLHGLLNPVPPPKAEGQLAGLVEGYSATSEWVHLVLSLDENSAHGNLTPIVPTLSLKGPSGSDSLQHTRAATPSPKQLSPEVEPTPRCDPEPPAQSYFTSRHSSPAHEPNLLPTQPSPNHIESFLAILKSPDQTLHSSITHFLTWRPHPSSPTKLIPTIPNSLASSITSSTSPAASLESDTGPIMPTVARAQGGGEWEAGLSRRVAKRRESEDGPRGPRDFPRGRGHRGGKFGRRPSSPARGNDDCRHPLFPRSTPPSGSVSRSTGLGVGLGLGDMVQRVFSPLRKVLGSSGGIIGIVGAAGLAVLAVGTTGTGVVGKEGEPGGWRRVAVACALALAVGWGCWNAA